MRNLNLIIIIAMSLLFVACGKEFLDHKRNSNQVIPVTVDDYQAILDWETIMNRTSIFLKLAASDEFDVTGEILSAIPSTQVWSTRAYVWEEDVFDISDRSLDWEEAYQRILYANLALDAKKLVGVEDRAEEVVGQALFHRAWNYYHLVTTFCEAYRPSEAANQDGVPLRLDYSVSKKITSSNLYDCYQVIEQDLLEAKRYLNKEPVNKFRANKYAVYALLAKLYLEMEKYEDAAKYGSLYLERHGQLLNFNDLDLTKRYVFSDYAYGVNNTEVIMHFNNTTVQLIGPPRHDVKKRLYPLYDVEDLRKDVFYYLEADGRVSFRGSYLGSAAFFTGIATNEVYLVMAECFVRLGDVTQAAQYLNTLLEHRYEMGKLTPVDFSDISETQALQKIYVERYKELCWRGIRWVDLKRYNKEERFKTTLQRFVNDELYELSPGSAQWKFKIPPYENRK